MDSGQAWNDFHFLNNTFRDTLKKYSVSRIEPTLVRFSYSGSRDKALGGKIDALENLLVEYAAPFPLTYIFGLHASRAYLSVLIFLLQIRRAKNVLEGMHMRGIASRQISDEYTKKIMFSMRSKLIWFTRCVLPSYAFSWSNDVLRSTLLDFIATHVGDHPPPPFSDLVLLAGRTSATTPFPRIFKAL
jgi:gamma-tubulin complex component 5